MKHIKQLQEQKDEIILMWDANSTVSDKEIINILDSTDMYDLMPTTHEK